MEFKDRLKQYRAENDLTQDELAEKLFVSRQAVSKYETGRSYPSVEVMQEIAKLLGVSLDELISKEELTKETLSTSNKTKRNKTIFIILSVITLIAVVISVVAIVLSSVNRAPAALPEEVDGYEFIGVAGMLDGNEPTAEKLKNGEMFGVCYMPEGKTFVWQSFNASALLAVYENDKVTYNAEILYSAKAKLVSMFMVYYDGENDLYEFRPATSFNTALSPVGFGFEEKKGDAVWQFNLDFKAVDELIETNIYEYGMDGVQIRASTYGGEKIYETSDDMLYIVVEEKFKDADGEIYFNREIIFNSDVDREYPYHVKTLNEYGFCTKSLTIVK